MMEMLMVTLIMAMRGINSRGPQAGQGVLRVSDAPSRVIGPGGVSYLFSPQKKNQYCGGAI